MHILPFFFLILSTGIVLKLLWGLIAGPFLFKPSEKPQCIALHQPHPQIISFQILQVTFPIVPSPYRVTMEVISISLAIYKGGQFSL